MKTLWFLFLAFMLIASCTPEQKNSAITPPLSGLDPAFTTYKLHSDTTSKILHATGTVISIPEGAFVRETGSVVKGEIKVMYREFHDALEIYLSGIPMSFESFGRQTDFETAGMFEIRASANDTALYLAPGKSIKVKFASQEPGADYNFFGLNENQEQWEFIDFVEPEPNPKRDSLNKLIADKKLPLQIPLEESFVFNYDGIIDIMVAAGMSWSELKDAKWLEKRAKSYGLTWLQSYAGESINYRGFYMPASLLVWKNTGQRIPRWAKTKNKDGYYVSANLEKITSVKYNLILSLERWNRETSSYDIKKKYKTRVQVVMPIKALFAFKPDTWKNNYAEAYAQVESYMESLKSEARAFRSMEITQLGIYNYDKLKKLDENAFFAEVDFTLDEVVDNKLYTLNKVSCFTQDNKSVLSFNRDRWKMFTLIPSDTNFRIITVLPENKIAMFSSKQYGALNFDSIRSLEEPKLQIELQVYDKPITTSEELEELLNFDTN